MKFFGLSMLLIVLTCSGLSLTSGLSSVGNHGHQEQLQPNLLVAVSDVQLNAVNLHLMASQIAYKYNVPVSLELAKDDDLSKPSIIAVNIKKSTLANVFDSIIQQKPLYAWQFTDGVVRVSPKNGTRDTVLQAVLDTRIRHFVVRNATSQITFREVLSKQPELKDLLERNGVAPTNEIFSSYDVRSLGHNFSMDVKSLTVQSILDHVIKHSDRRYWFINRYGENRQHLLINF